MGDSTLLFCDKMSGLFCINLKLILNCYGLPYKGLQTFYAKMSIKSAEVHLYLGNIICYIVPRPLVKSA